MLQGFDRSLLPRIRKAQAGSKKGTGKDAVSIYEKCIMRYYFFGHQLVIAFLPSTYKSVPMSFLLMSA